MKQFWTTAFGAFVGSFGAIMIFSIISVLFSLIFIIMLSSSFSTEVTTTITPQSVLHIKLDGNILERSTPDDALVEIFSDEPKGAGLDEIIKSIEIASKDSKIQGIYIDCGYPFVGASSANSIREALLKFKKGGKWIYAYSNEGMTQSNYYIASTADSLFMNHEGILVMTGLSMNTMLFKNMLDKIGVEMQVVKVGTFKSAVEPYMQTEISEANRTQQQVLLDQMWGVIAGGIAKSRNIPLAKINEFADSVIMTKPTSFLLANKLIDGVCYKPEMEDKLKDKVDTDELSLVSPKELIASTSVKSKENKIAVLYAVGEINSASDEGIVADELIKNIQDAADNDDVKALVMRVNSPGGSAFDSEQIWAALEEFKKSEKPFVVSMSDYAASGGYYISCGADLIYADPLTITGSIGIFGVVPCLQGLLEDKIGINSSVVKTNANAEFINVSKKMTPYQRQSMQIMVNRGYELFTSRCAAGRGMSQDSIKAIAEGRVWDGKTALKLGLVDMLGGLDDAVKKAANLAKVNDYSIKSMPEQKDMFAKYFSKYIVARVKSSIVGESGVLLEYQKIIDNLLKQDHLQARMETIVIN